MSSGAIMALIMAKRAEADSLKATLENTSGVGEVMNCLEEKYRKAGNYISKAGTIDGKPFDQGKTVEMATDLGKICEEIGATIDDLNTKIASLEAEISGLYAQYRAALAREEAERKAAEAYAAAQRQKKGI